MTVKKRASLFLLSVFVFSSFMFGQTEPPPNDEAEKARISENYDQWKGLGFGMAVGLAIPFTRIVEKYEIVENILRVTGEKTGIGQVLLESHYFFPIRRPMEGKYSIKLRQLNEEYVNSLNDVDNINQKERYFRAVKELEDIKSLRSVGIGPFVAILPGTDRLLKAFGFGPMIGFRRGKSSNSFNIGIGYVNYSDMAVLADNVKRNEPLPAGIKEPVKSTNSHSLLLLFSFTF